MKRLTTRDGVAAAVFAAIVVPYVGYLIRGDMPFVKDARGMAGVGLVGLVGLAAAFAAWRLQLDTVFGKTMTVVGFAAAGLGVAAAVVGSEGSDALLGLFIAGVTVVWAAETLFDAGLFHHHA